MPEVSSRRKLLKGGGVVGLGGLLAFAGPKAVAVAAGLLQTTKTANYTLRASDADKVINFDTAGPVVLTIPADVGETGMTVEICQIGAGQVRIVGSGVTVVDSPASLTTRARYSTIGLRKRGTSRWLASGDTT